jgi:hypothetical protein
LINILDQWEDGGNQKKQLPFTIKTEIENEAARSPGTKGTDTHTYLHICKHCKKVKKQQGNYRTQNNRTKY